MKRMTNEIECNKRSKSMVKDTTNVLLKKGPWTAAEDAILIDYIAKHGEGNWNAVQKQSGLSRCGKSCRLRWTNHLRPDLKKGAFTAEEERQVIELHAKMGNKWAQMAAEIPGRTDNEIKNYWNTRSKRLQRAGLPIYPPEICLQVHDRSHESQDMGTPQSSEIRNSDLLQTEQFEIPEVEFENLVIKHGPLSYSPNIVDIPTSSILKQDVNPSNSNSHVFLTSYAAKRLRESDSIFPDLDGDADNPSVFIQSIDYSSEKISKPFGLSSTYASQCNYYGQKPLALLPDSHAILHDDSSSEPFCGAMKFELPSLQYSETHQDSWGILTSPLPSLESSDALIQSPPTELTQSDCFIPRSNDMLEAVLSGSPSLQNLKTCSDQQLSATSIAISDLDDCPVEIDTEWDIHGDPNSPLGHSATSFFSASNPIGRSSSDEPVIDLKPETANQVIIEERKAIRHISCARPDVLLDWGWFTSGNGHIEGMNFQNDDIQVPVVNDINC